jgi:hypothetical protein
MAIAMTIKQIIELCGGEHEIVARFRMANTWLVRRWITHGIPLKNWPTLIQMAAERKKKLTGEQLWQAVRPVLDAASQES